jgi:LysR family transcriptional regulator for bpeEF and oprC
MRNSIRTISIFVAVVEAKSFAAAARTLLIDPAALSRAIKFLEVDLGVVLFARSTRFLRLTNEGVRFYRDCVQILKKLDEATHQFRVQCRQP